jgi:WD40 repeat protein
VADENVNTILFDQNIQTEIFSITVSPLGGFVAYITLDLTINVWNISSETLIFSQKEADATKIKLIDETQLLVQKAKSYTIINFDNEKIIEFNDGISSDIVVSNRNGLLIAVGTERFVNIYANPDVFVNTFTMPLDNEKLISLSFSPNDNLMVFTDLNNVYVLSPTPCPNTYISDNLKCICPDTYVEDNNKCICSVNYIETNSRCICPDSFIEQSQKCFCMDELFAIDGACR